MDDNHGSHMAIAAIAALLAVPVLFLAPLFMVSLLMGGGMTQTGDSVSNVPDQYLDDVRKAGNICQIVTAPVIAAQIETESNWNINSSSPVGAKGIAQFMPATWAAVGKDGDGDGKADILNPHDAIWTQGNYMCGLAGQIDSMKSNGVLSGDTLQLTLAAYNAGIGSVQKAKGIPPFKETQAYVQKILALMPKYTDTSGSGDTGGAITAGQLKPPLSMMPDGKHINIAAMGITNTYYGGPSGYPPKQCTWWVANRRANIGHPVDNHMGNGGFWITKARALGYGTGRTPQVGAAMSISPGVFGSSGIYGHVALVEQVNPDGGIVVSESGSSMSAPQLRTFSAQQLQAAASSVWFIY
ncbi:MAG: CHAP domain-containing protein [Bifidobacterium crudilactis]|uniref:lytic transglycosylase domain-containing protein n=1 Tax=Bifidobacterium crudilactis TaxID=327277 RepID=UPI003F9E8786